MDEYVNENSEKLILGKEVKGTILLSYQDQAILFQF